MTISHHKPTLQNKVRRLYFYPFANFTWLLGLSHKNRSYLRTSNHNISSIIISMIPFRGPRLQIPHPLKSEKQDTRQATYTVQAVCQVWNQSRVRVRVRSVASRFIQRCRIHEQVRGRETTTDSMTTQSTCVLIVHA